MFFRFFIMLLGCFLAMPTAWALDKSDAGVFVLLDAQSRPTHLQMRYRLVGSQWQMESRTHREAWRAMCRHSASCALRPARASEMRRWQRVLPAKWRERQLDCIKNSAFAFCRVGGLGKGVQRAYWWFALRPSVHALPLRRE